MSDPSLPNDQSVFPGHVEIMLAMGNIRFEIWLFCPILPLALASEAMRNLEPTGDGLSVVAWLA